MSGRSLTIAVPALYSGNQTLLTQEMVRITLSSLRDYLSSWYFHHENDDEISHQNNLFLV